MIHVEDILKKKILYHACLVLLIALSLRINIRALFSKEIFQRVKEVMLLIGHIWNMHVSKHNILWLVMYIVS